MLLFFVLSVLFITLFSLILFFSISSFVISSFSFISS